MPRKSRRGKLVPVEPGSEEEAVTPSPSHLTSHMVNPVQGELIQQVKTEAVSNVDTDDTGVPQEGEEAAAQPSVEQDTSVQAQSTNTSLSVIEKELHASLGQPVDKNEFYQYLGLSMDKYDISMDQETATRYKRHIMSLKHGMHAGIPLTCYGGRKCPIGSRCPFTKIREDGTPDYDASTYPLFKACPIEKDMIQIHMIDLVEEYQIGPEDYTDLAIVSKLAALDVLEFRCNMSLATDHEGMVISEVSSVDYQSGKEFITRKINPAFEILEKIHRIKQDLVKSMVGTRREKYKAAAATGEVANKSKMTQNMQDLVKIIEKKKLEEQGDIIDADFSESE